MDDHLLFIDQQAEYDLAVNILSEVGWNAMRKAHNRVVDFCSVFSYGRL